MNVQYTYRRRHLELSLPLCLQNCICTYSKGKSLAFCLSTGLAFPETRRSSNKVQLQLCAAWIIRLKTATFVLFTWSIQARIIRYYVTRHVIWVSHSSQLAVHLTSYLHVSMQEESRAQDGYSLKHGSCLFSDTHDTWARGGHSVVRVSYCCGW